MAMNPEGSRDSGQAGEDRSEPRFSAVGAGPPAAPGVPPVPSPSQPPREPTVEEDLAEEYEAALEGQVSASHFSIDIGRASTEVELDGQPTSVDGEPHTDEED